MVEGEPIGYLQAWPTEELNLGVVSAELKAEPTDFEFCTLTTWPRCFLVASEQEKRSIYLLNSL